MKRVVTFISAIFLAGLACACTPSGPVQASPLPRGFVAPFENVHYEKIPVVNPRKVKELKITLPQEMEMPQVIALPGGGALALGQKVTYGDKKEVLASKIMAAKYDPAGKTLWTKEIDGLDEGTVQATVPLPGGAIAFTYVVRVPYASGGSVSPNAQRLVFCAPDGTVLQKVETNQPGLFMHLCVTDDGEVFAVGTGYFKDGKPIENPAQYTADTDISIMKFNRDGKLLFARNYGGKGYDNPTLAAWSRDAGLALAVCMPASNVDTYSQISNQYSPDTQVSVLMLFDRDGNRKWQYFHEGQNRLYYGELLGVSGGFLAEGFNDGKELIWKLSLGGKKLCEVSPDGEGMSTVIAMETMPSGGFAAAVNRYNEADPSRGVYLSLFDKDGTQTRKIKLPNEMTREILATDDGGLLTVGVQNVKCLPQPAYVSSIWYDTETIVTKYDKDLNIQWRKVYDKYKDSIKPDVAVPVADGSIIVEK